jgi:tetratricopeptide (TPR) repeat protein
MAEDDLKVPSLQRERAQGLLDEGDDTGALVARLVQAQTALEQERASAPSLLAELMVTSRAAQLERVAVERRFQTWGMCEILLDQSQQAEERDPPEAARLASLALAAADRLDLGLHMPAVVQDLKARLWAAAGEARRRAGELSQAEEALRKAASCLAQGTGDLLVEARLLEFEAAVRQAQGRGGEAAGLLKQASSRYLEVHEFHLLARTLARREQLLRDAPQPQMAHSVAWKS